MKTSAGKLNAEADAAIWTGVAMDIAACIIMSRISRRGGLTDIPEVFARNPDAKPFVATGS